MPHCTNHYIRLLGLVLSVVFLFCGCQSGMVPISLPDTAVKDTSQGKAQLLSALNQEYYARLQTANHFRQGSDTTAEAVLLYLQQNSGGNAAKVDELLTEDDDTGLVRCADDLLSRLSLSPSESCRVGYAFLEADMLDEDGALRSGADFSVTARTLLNDRAFLVWADGFSGTASEQTGFAVGTIGGKALVVAVFSV